MLKVDSLFKSYGALLATDNLSFQVKKGDIHAIIGPNGAGKTTLIGQLTGEIESDSGSILFDGNNISGVPVHLRSAHGLARSFQITNIFHDLTTWDNVALAVQAHAGHSFHFWKNASKERELRQPALEFLGIVGLEKRAGFIAGLLSHGEHRQLEIAMALATNPKMLLLDEPMAGMNIEEKQDMCRFVLDVNDQYGTTIALIEHDMGVVMDISDKVVVLDYGKKLAEGTPDEIRGNQTVIDAYLGVPHN